MTTISHYRQETDRLFSQWKNTPGTIPHTVNGAEKARLIDHQNSVFVRDGVVCPEIWFSREFRPLFLLKEAYGGTADWDLARDHLLATRRASKMWQRVSAWTKGLRAVTADTLPPYDPDDRDLTHYGNDYLKQIAVINIKKSGGQRSSDPEEIRAYAEFDRHFLCRELELCDPTVIICGCTGALLECITEQPFRRPRNRDLFYLMPLNGHDVLVLDYWHPANQYPDLMNYYTLMSIYQQALRARPSSP